MVKKNYEIWVNQDGIEDLEDLEKIGFLTFQATSNTRDVGFGQGTKVIIECDTGIKNYLENLWDCNLE